MLQNNNKAESKTEFPEKQLNLLKYSCDSTINNTRQGLLDNQTKEILGNIERPQQGKQNK